MSQSVNQTGQITSVVLQGRRNKFKHTFKTGGSTSQPELIGKYLEEKEGICGRFDPLRARTIYQPEIRWNFDIGITLIVVRQARRYPHHIPTGQFGMFRESATPFRSFTLHFPQVALPPQEH